LKGFKHWLYDKDDTLISNDADHPTVVRLYELVQKHIDKNMVKTEKKYAINHKQTWNRLHAEGYEGYTRNIVDLVRQLPENFLREDWCVLDIGCGAGYHMEYMAQRVREVYGVDISIKAVEIAVKRLSKFDNVYVYEGTGDSLNMFPDNTFDFVYSMATFQHIPKAFTENYLKETLRCLKPNGKMLFHVIHRLNPEENKGDIGLIKNEETRGYDKETLREMVAKSGLKLDKIIRQKLGRRGNQLEWLWAWCSK
jgi:cyclopropane fatty-acyl-phospholipid synthase-like methyltransferase